MPSQSGSANSMQVSTQEVEVFDDGPMDYVMENGVPALDHMEVHNVAELQDRLLREHWGWKQLWNEEVSRVAIGPDQGQAHGQLLSYVKDQLGSLEEELREAESFSADFDRMNIAALSLEPGASKLAGLDGDQLGCGSDQPRVVLQTYTVPLSEVTRDFELWKEPLELELKSLVDTGTIRRVKVDQLPKEPGYDRMEIAPAKVVRTIKSPVGKRKARIVICGNLVHPAGHVQMELEESKGASVEHDIDAFKQGYVGASEDGGHPNRPGGGPKGHQPSSQSLGPSDLYAGGVDSSALRCVLRKGAGESWQIATTDVKGAFLLAPRSQEKRPLLVIQPPRLLVSTGLIPEDERWICDGAMYGLDTSPADWASYRDHHMARFRWETAEHRYHLLKAQNQIFG
eukprot:s9_g49.t1